MLCSLLCKIKVFPGKYFSCSLLFLGMQVVGHPQLHSPPSSLFLKLFLFFPLMHVYIFKELHCIYSQNMVKCGDPHSHLKPLQGGSWQDLNGCRSCSLSPATVTGGVAQPPASHGVVELQLCCSPILFITASARGSVCYWKWTGLRALFLCSHKGWLRVKKNEYTCKACLFPWKQNFFL